MRLDLIDEQLSMLSGLLTERMTKKQQKKKDDVFRSVYKKRDSSWDRQGLAIAFRKAADAGVPVEVKAGKAQTKKKAAKKTAKKTTAEKPTKKKVAKKVAKKKVAKKGRR